MAQDQNDYTLTGAAVEKMAEMWRWYQRNSRNAHPPRYRRQPRVGGVASFRVVRFSLPSALTSSTPSVASCPVIRVANGTNPGSTITAYNEDGWESDAGSEGWAFFDNSTQHWIIFVVPCATANSSSSS